MRRLLILDQSKLLSTFKRLDRFDLCLILLVVISYVVVSKLPFAPQKFGDGVFHNEARSAALAVRGTEPWTKVKISRAPGPVLYYAVPYLLLPSGSSDESYWRAAFVWSVLWMSAATLLLRRAAAIKFGSDGGKLAALLTLILPLNVYYSYGIVAEPPAYAAVTLVTYGWARWSTSDNRFTLFNAGGLLTLIGLVVLLFCRPNAILLPPIGIVVAVLNRKNRREAAFALQVALAGLVVFVLAFLALAQLPGGWQSGNFSHVLFHGRFQYRTEPWDWRFWDDTTRQGSADHALFRSEEAEIILAHNQTGTPISQLKRSWSINDAIDHPDLTLQMALIRVLSLNIALVNSKTPDEFKIGPLQGRPGYLLFHVALNFTYLVMLLSALSFVYQRRATIASYWVLWAPWAALLLFHALTYAEPRYMFPGQPGLLIMAAVTLVPILNVLNHRLLNSRLSRCNLCVLCEIVNHRDTENTEVAQRRNRARRVLSQRRRTTIG